MPVVCVFQLGFDLALQEGFGQALDDGGVAHAQTQFACDGADNELAIGGLGIMEQLGQQGLSCILGPRTREPGHSIQVGEDPLHGQ